MIGIEDISFYLPENSISNYDQKEMFGINDHFIEKKLGIKKTLIKNAADETSDLCIKAYKNVINKKGDVNIGDVEVLVVITQNPDMNIPHTSAIVHGKLDLSENCACFDISLGCSGYVYGLSIIESFMKENNFTKGLLFTADPYSKIINRKDKVTSLLFGDAATVTIISNKPIYQSGKCTFGTVGKRCQELKCENGELFMDGHAVFDFALEYVPRDIELLLKKNNIKIHEVDKFVFHQGSKYIVDSIARILGLPNEKVVFDAEEYGNTISSSIPIILSKEIQKENNKTILISGFGVGLSWSGNILGRV
ncbi:3-oxoacyl-ACP synthase [candidate division WOR-1 bacterium RIFOXYA12_FULL_43_27]|uniref:3-oxoacyl-ACP synthase n=1 Tax=candidate division WOR-1 bacterium RIFOXYC2_FULL_46_14 TaxID=1802587 RepID=A0A1F4U3I9_UNCSA|nr:MAG: 3-oxoacyl-ACP synthase [candidate division WOR-1 bacterium RIFOXYA12_FULL_43_27]OGC20203.1 MAG: 3-oxoacyl-ACP synthase [candidate division WOR-1 bacterium RIFOXYB2_FULL_46_45]OGC32059.1 MAG: 3-oxoacyl-ACP synthase [candidate division WOR-1 bacterium RIFOXYA2_FULL_46_56]OGC39461.1 MAG: 3-oxoacyl-ACP synthase [candidate division WOR-1 bacterium RIFOXYC2_FULL_46_14]